MTKGKCPLTGGVRLQEGEKCTRGHIMHQNKYCKACKTTCNCIIHQRVVGCCFSIILYIGGAGYGLELPCEFKFQGDKFFLDWLEEKLKKENFDVL